MPLWLQWGRDRAVAEFGLQRWGGALLNRFNGAATARSRNFVPLPNANCMALCFNGAATARSRNSRSLTSGLALVYWLQWGRDRAVAEFAQRGHDAGTGPRFNGAATARSRN